MLEFVLSGILAIIGAIVGGLIAYYAQTRTQERAWKREYGVQIAEEVFGSLFSAIKSVIFSLEEKSYSPLNFDAWRGMQYNHRHLMVAKKFREKLDGFLNNVEEYDLNVQKLRNEVLPRIISEEIAKFFKVLNVRPEEIDINIQYTEANRLVSTSPNIIECLISQTHPRDYALKHARQESKVLSFQMSLYRKSHDVDKFDECWNSILGKMKADQNYQLLLQQTDRLLEEAKSIKRELAKRIEEPWKI